MVPKVDPRPSFMDEYLSVAGNAGGGLDEYWDVIYEYPRIMGGAIWDFVSPGLREPVRELTDSSPNNVATHIMGRAKLVAGHDGKGIDLNGHDQWVEVYQDRNIEISGDELTVSLWIFPRDLMKMGEHCSPKETINLVCSKLVTTRSSFISTLQNSCPL